IDAAELLFLLAQEKGIGAKALAAVEIALSENRDKSPITALTGVAGPDLPETVQERFMAMKELAARLTEQASVAEAVELLCRHYELDQEETDLILFLEMAASSPTLPAFAEHLRRHQDSLIYDDRAEAVLLATLHAAKGLEFRAVFMAGCEEGLLPLIPRNELSSEAEQEHFAEERRLFFVGITRAAEVLYLTGAGERRGFTGLEQRIPSRFLTEIPPELLRNPPTVIRKQKKKVGKQLSLF
ncbi:MAG: DNA helicase II, partial [Candidatus Electrothrix sp. AUS1_2]|nr:DNA helicase II [Candidatus Electrothrix sp. AUS1_2]